MPGNSSERKLGNYSVYFVCFPPLRDNCVALFDVQCLKTVVSYILSCFAVVSDMRVNLVSGLDEDTQVDVSKGQHDAELRPLANNYPQIVSNVIESTLK